MFSAFRKCVHNPICVRQSIVMLKNDKTKGRQDWHLTCKNWTLNSSHYQTSFIFPWTICCCVQCPWYIPQWTTSTSAKPLPTICMRGESGIHLWVARFSSMHESIACVSYSSGVCSYNGQKYGHGLCLDDRHGSQLFSVSTVNAEILRLFKPQTTRCETLVSSVQENAAEKRFWSWNSFMTRPLLACRKLWYQTDGIDF